MNDTIIREEISGARNLRSILTMIILFFAGIGFFLAGLSSYFHKNFLILTDTSQITFLPQGIAMLFYGTGAFGIGIYLLLKKNPQNGKKMLYYANNLVKFMPIDKSSVEMFSPIFDFTSKDDSSFMESVNGIYSNAGFSGEKRMMNSGKNGTKRSVSETKKKYVASNQEWKCGNCHVQLDHTFEIDHKVRLEYGGGNDVQNLIALCRNCHGKKTASENM
jgi:hypothetical protein